MMVEKAMTKTVAAQQKEPPSTLPFLLDVASKKSRTQQQVKVKTSAAEMIQDQIETRGSAGSVLSRTRVGRVPDSTVI